MMKTRLKDKISRLATLALAIAAGFSAQAAIFWGSSSGNYSAPSNWTTDTENELENKDSVAEIYGKNVHFGNASAGTTVTMDAYDEYVWYCWFWGTSATSPVTFTAQDNDDTKGFKAYWGFHICSAANDVAGLVINHGLYAVPSPANTDQNASTWGGGNNAKPYLELNGGSIDLWGHDTSDVYGCLYIGKGTGVESTIKIAGGKLAVNGGRLVIGTDGDATSTTTIDISNGGVLSCGTDTTEHWIMFGNTGTGTADINIKSGGTLAAWFFTHVSTGQCNLKIDGGTLKALGATTHGNGLFDTYFAGETDTFSVEVTSNGGYLDTNGKAITIKKAITGAGALEIIGGGSVDFTVAPTCPLKISAAGTSVTLPANATAPTTDLADYYIATTDNLTYTLAAKVYTWHGAEGANWSEATNWYYDAPNGTTAATSAPTADSAVVIPANSTVTLDTTAAAVASITADSSVTITMTSSARAANLTTALKNTAWQGTLQFVNDTEYNKTTQQTFYYYNYGNENSTIEYASACKVNRFQSDGNFAGKLKISGTLTIGESGNVVGVNSAGHKTQFGYLTGDGTWIIGGGINGTKYQYYVVGDISGFTGTINVIGAGVCLGMTGSNPSAQTFNMDKNATLGAGVTISAASLVNIHAKTFTLSGNANFGSATTIANGATFNYATLGTVAFTSVPTLSGTVTINIPDGVTPTAVDTVLMTWATEEEPTITVGSFTLTGSLDAEDYELQVVGNNSLVLHYTKAPYAVYVNDAISSSHSTLQEAVDAAMSLGTYDYISMMANGSASVTAANAANLKLKPEAGVVAAISLDTAEYAAVAGEADANGVVTYSTQIAATTYTLAVTDGTWDTAANWTHGDSVTATRAPTTGDTVVIPANLAVTFSGTDGITLASLTVNGSLTLASSTAAVLTGENALADAAGTGWIVVSDATPYAAVAFSVAAGTLSVPADSTFKDIAAATVYVSGTVTAGTTLDANGNIGNGSTLFTLTDGTFANNTVTAYINNADTDIHWTKNTTTGAYTAGKVYYWINTSTAQTTGDVSNNINKASAWSTVSSSSSEAAADSPLVFDTAVFNKSAKRAIVNANMPYNIFVESEFHFLAKDKNSEYTIGTKFSKFTIADGVTAYIEAGQNTTQGKIRFYSVLEGNASATLRCEAPCNSSYIHLYGDYSLFKGLVDAYPVSTEVVSHSGTRYSQIRLCIESGDDFYGEYAKWCVSTNGEYMYRSGGDYRDNSMFFDSKTYKLGSLKTYVSNTSKDGSSYKVNYNVTIELGEKLDENSWLRNSWCSKDADYGGKVKWLAKTATFTQAVKNAYEVDIMGGGKVYVEASETENAENEYVPSVIKFLQFTDSENVVRKGGYLTIDDSNSAIAANIINAIAAAGSGETQAAIGFNVTAANGATAAVTSWSALAAAGIVKKGDGTLTLTGTPSGNVKITVEAGELVTPNTLDYTLVDVMTKKKDGENGTYVFYKATGIATDGTAEITEIADQAAADAAAADYVVTLTKAQEKQGLSADYYNVKATAKAGAENTYVLTPVLKDEVKPKVAEGVKVVGTTVTIPATNLKKGLRYRVATGSAAGSLTSEAAWSAIYDGTEATEPTLTAELPESGVLYYAIEASDTAE